MKAHLIKNRAEFADWFSRFHLSLKEDSYPFTIQVTKGARKHRSLEQNNLIHGWYRDLAQQSKDTFEGIKRECKLTCGVPILRADNEEFAEMWERMIKGHPYEERLKMMDYLDVSSIMTTTQLSEYIEQVYFKYTGVGYHLELP